MTSNSENTSSKRPYVKPTLTRVELVAEEAVMGPCYTNTASGRFRANPCRRFSGGCWVYTQAAQQGTSASK